MTGRLLSRIILEALVHNEKSNVIIMGRSLDSLKHSLMVVYMVLKLSGGALMMGRNSMADFSIPDSLWINFIKLSMMGD